MKVQLYNPPVHHYAGQHYFMNPPLSLPIISAVLNESNINCEVVDLEGMKISPSQLGATYRAQYGNWPDAIGFTITHFNRRGAQDCIGILRNIGYDGYIAIGGAEVTALPDEFKDWQVDAIVLGECEANVLGIFGGKFKGVIRGFALPIEDIPAPLWDRHFPKPNQYPGNQPKIGHPEGISMWSRGCPHPCIFCGNAVFGQQKIRFRPPKQIAKELLSLKKYGIRALFVYDDELVGASNQQNVWLKEVADEIEDFGMFYKGQGRCSQRFITEECLSDLYRMGFRVIMWGVESFSDKVLKSIRKGTTEDDVWHTLDLSKRAGLQNWVFLMVGNYEETVEDLAYTHERLGEANRRGLVDHRQVTVCTPLPGTLLWERAKVEGWWVEPPEVGAQMAQVFAPTPWLTREEIGTWRQKLLSA